MSQPISPFFIADSLGLDFLNSVATPVDVPIDWIDGGEGLLSWLEQSCLVPADVLGALRERAMPGEIDRLAAQARSLREWVRTFVRERKGRPLAAADLEQPEPLNMLLARDEGFGKIAALAHEGAVVLRFERSRRGASAELLLLPIGEILAKLVCEEDFSYGKACEGPTGPLMFADPTLGHGRHWGSM